MSDERKFRHKILIFIIVSLVVSAMGNICLSLSMMHAASKLGTEIAEQCFKAEEKNIQGYFDLVTLGRQYMDDMAEEETSPAEVVEWMDNYFQKNEKVSKGEEFHYYACYQGSVYANRYYKGREGYDYKKQEWYQDSLKRDQGATLSFNFDSTNIGFRIGTIANINPETGNGFAIDLYPEDFKRIHKKWDTSLGETYYLMDAEGKLIYTGNKQESAATKNFAKKMQGKHKVIAKDENGRWALTYSYTSNKQWQALLCIPLWSLFGQTIMVTVIYAGTMCVFIVVVMEMLKKSEEKRRQNREKKRIIDAVASIYYIGCYINTTTDKHKMLMDVGGQYAFEKEKTSAREFVDVACRHYVDEAFQEKVQAFMDFDTIGERLKNKCYLTCEYISTVCGWVRIFLIPISLKKDMPVTEFLMLNQVIDEERVKDLEKSVEDVTALYEDSVKAMNEIRHLNEEQLDTLKEVQTLNEKLKVSTWESQQANQAKSDFLSRMSHDIRTPMNVIVGLTDLAKNKINQPQKIAEYLDKIEAESIHLQTLVNDILDISAIESQKLKVNQREESVEDMARRINNSVKSQVGARELTYTYVKGEMKYPFLMMDKLRISQIYSNLLSNAVKYTPNGGKILFELWQVPSEKEGKVLLCARVKDTGIGMSKEFMKNMYAEFVRGTDTRINKIQGSGLGLAIVKQLTDLMKGTVETKSKEGEGTEFVVKIPLAYAQGGDNQKERKESPILPEKLAGKKILVAEDYDVNYEITKEMLQNCGIEVERGVDGVAAVEKFKCSEEKEYDLILMDIMMPVMDGLEATREIRSLHRNDAKTIPIIAMTANAFAEDANECLAAGMNAHLSKPVEMKLLLRAIQDYLE